MSSPGLGSERAVSSKHWILLALAAVLATGWGLGGCADKPPPVPEPSPSREVVEAPAPAAVAPAAESDSMPRPQVIVFADPGDQVVTNRIALDAKATSGLRVAFGGMGPCSVRDSNILTFTGTGEVTVVAIQPGNGQWKPAAPVAHQFVVREARSPR